MSEGMELKDFTHDAKQDCFHALLSARKLPRDTPGRDNLIELLRRAKALADCIDEMATSQ